MLGAVSVPEREDGVVVKVPGHVHSPVHTAVLAVHVHVDGGVDERVVERGVDHGLLVVRALAFDASELLLPGLTRRGVDLVEGLARGLSPEILQCALFAHGRERHLHGELLRGEVIKVEVGHNVAAGHLGEVVVDVEVAPEALILLPLHVAVAVAHYGLAEAYGEVGVAAARPSLGHAKACEQRVVVHTE